MKRIALILVLVLGLAATSRAAEKKAEFHSAAAAGATLVPTETALDAVSSYLASSTDSVARMSVCRRRAVSARIIHEAIGASRENGSVLRLNQRFRPCRRLHLLGEAESDRQNANRCEKTR
jgi:hypothetical protein